MLSRADAKRVLKVALSLSRADESIVNLSGGTSSLTRYAENQIHQNATEERFSLTVRSRLGQRMGSATTNRLDGEAVERVVRRSEAIARLMPEDPDALPAVETQTYVECPRYDAETAAMSPKDRADRVGRSITLCKENGLRGAGRYASGDSAMVAVAASTGLLGYHPETQAGLNITVLSDNSEGGGARSSWRARDIDVELLTRRSVEKALLGRDPVAVVPGRYTVILEPTAASSFLGFLTRELKAKAPGEQPGLLDEMSGEGALDRRISVIREPDGVPFDADGLPIRRVSLIEKGVVRELLTDRLVAAKTGAEPSGGGGKTVMDGGDRSLDELVTSTRRGILITELHYTKCTDPARLTINGMTRHGTFLVEEGKVVRGLKNLRFSQSVLQTLRSGIGEIGRRETDDDVPPLVIPDFHIVSVAED